MKCQILFFRKIKEKKKHFKNSTAEIFTQSVKHWYIWERLFKQNAGVLLNQVVFLFNAEIPSTVSPKVSLFSLTF